jgi:hypothetical protein
LCDTPPALDLPQSCESRLRPDAALLSLAFRTPELKSGSRHLRGPGEVDDDAARSSPRQFLVDGLLGRSQNAVPERAPLAAIQARRGIASWLEASPADGRDAPPPLGFGEHVLGLARAARAVAANPASAASASCCHSTHCSRVRRRRR